MSPLSDFIEFEDGTILCVCAPWSARLTVAPCSPHPQLTAFHQMDCLSNPPQPPPDSRSPESQRQTSAGARQWLGPPGDGPGSTWSTCHLHRAAPGATHPAGQPGPAAAADQWSAGGRSGPLWPG
ncbi:hypothetical protein HaLaN_22917 [Haematococcus lacustris]|uniref:Uncharacterized protein n=1 Tax=Haematococcus lacustris TaxID=44745 RepID=A0A6A0A0Q0_HAELA|nr:hypothetical protein HaLaN_22917 [Haematococcus lacustris]